jgi:hypothetical protein
LKALLAVLAVPLDCRKKTLKIGGRRGIIKRRCSLETF